MFFTVIDEPGGNGSGFAVGMVFDGRENGSGAAGVLRFYRLTAFEDAPAVIAAGLDAIDQFPEFPTDIGDPEFAGFFVKAHAPGITKTVSVNLGAGVLIVHEWIVFRDGIIFSTGGVMNIDAENGGEKIGDVLAGVEDVGRGGAGRVTCAYVQIVIVAEFEAATVMAAGEPGDKDFFGGEVELWLRMVGDAKAGDAGAVRFFRLEDITEIGEAVGGEEWIKGDGVGFGHFGNGSKIGRQRRSAAVFREGVELAGLFQNEPAIKVG